MSLATNGPGRINHTTQDLLAIVVDFHHKTTLLILGNDCDHSSSVGGDATLLAPDLPIVRRWFRHDGQTSYCSEMRHKGYVVRQIGNQERVADRCWWIETLDVDVIDACYLCWHISRCYQRHDIFRTAVQRW